MGDKQHRGAQFPLQLLDHHQHLGLDGDIQGGGGLVGDEQLGVAGQGDGDDHPLLHPAGKLVGVLVGPHRLDPHLLQHPQCLAFRFPPGAFAVEADDLGDLVVHRDHRIQGGHGILEDHRDLVAPDGPHLLFSLFQQVLPLVEDLPGDDPARRVGDQPQQPQGGGGLARPGLPHQAQGFPWPDGKVDAVDGPDHRPFGGVVDTQVLYL